MDWECFEENEHPQSMAGVSLMARIDFDMEHLDGGAHVQASHMMKAYGGNKHIFD